MAWVRIDDRALSHPKIVGMVDTRRPFDLWVWGLSYAQLHLTDGRLPNDAIPKGVAKAAQELCRRGLWEAQDEGFRIHDFLDWNDSRAMVTDRREAADEERQVTRYRLKRWREAKKKKRNGECNAPVTPLHDRIANADVTLLTKPNQTLVQKDPLPAASDLSAPPTTRGNQHGRIFVHRWQLDALMDSLGPHAADFRLDEWVFGLSALADSKGLVLEKKAVWGWVQQQLSEEIRRRGLPVASAGSDRKPLYAQTTAEMARDVAVSLGVDPEFAGIPK